MAMPAGADEYRTYAEVAYVANRLSHRYGFGCDEDPQDQRDDLLADQWFTHLRLTPAWLADLDRRAPGLFAVARQIIS